MFVQLFNLVLQCLLPEYLCISSYNYSNNSPNYYCLKFSLSRTLVLPLNINGETPFYSNVDNIFAVIN